MARNNSIILDIGAKVDKSWQASLNNVGTDLNKVGKAIHAQNKEAQKSSNVYSEFSNKLEETRKDAAELEKQLNKLHSVQANAKEGIVDTSVLSDRDKRGIVRRAKVSDYTNAEEIIKQQSELTRLRKLQNNYNRDIARRQTKATSFEASGNTKQSAKLYTEIGALRKRLQAVNTEILSTEENLKSLFAFENIRTDSPLVTGKVLDVVDEAIPRVERALNRANDKIRSYESIVNSAEQQTDKAVSNMGNIFNQYIAHVAVDAVQKLLSSFVQLGKTATKQLARMFGVISKTVTQVMGLQQAVKLLVQYGFGFRSLYYLVRRLRTGIEAGFEYLGGAVKSSRKAISGFSEEVGELITKVKELGFYMKSAAAAMFQPFMPLINSVIPRLVEWFNALSIAVANFIATLTGQSKIFVASTNLEDYATALDQVAGSADKAREALGAYDKLNVIHDDKNKGGGGSNLDTSGWFTEQATEPSKLAQMIKEAWEKADFTEVGIYIGEKFKALLEGIEWDDKVFPMVRKIAKSIATFINGITSVEDLGVDIGKTVANVFNSITLYIETFSKTLKWEQVGTFIAEALTSLFDTFDAGQLGSALHSFADGILTMLGIIFRDMDTTKLGEDIGDFFENLNIPDLASKLWNVAKQFVFAFAEALESWAKTDPESFGIAKAILTASAATKLIKLTIPIALQLGQAGVIDFSSLFSGLSLPDISSLLESSAIGQTFTALSQDIMMNGFWPTITTFFQTGLESFVASLAGFLTTPVGMIVAVLGSGLIGEIANSWDDGKSTLENILTGLGNVWNNLYYNIIEPIVSLISSVVIPIWSALKEAFSDIAGALAQIFIPICQALATVFDSQILPIIKSLFELLKAIWSWWSPILTTLISIIGKVVATVISAIASIIKAVTPVAQFIAEVVGGTIVGAIELVTSTVNTLGTKWNEIWDGIKDKVRSVANTIIGFLNKLLGGIEKFVNNAFDGLNKFKMDPPAWVTDLFGIKTFGFNFKHIQIPRIPELAQGAVIPPNRQFVAMLGDQTSGTNIEAPLDTIKQALVEALGESANTSPIVLQLDGKTIAKAVWDENEKRYKQLGKYSY